MALSVLEPIDYNDTKDPDLLGAYHKEIKRRNLIQVKRNLKQIKTPITSSLNPKEVRRQLWHMKK